jgi:hypothetical protein
VSRGGPAGEAAAEKEGAMPHRGIATLSLGLMLSFLLLSHFDSQFFLIHFYESLIYLVIVLMLFYWEDRWAYMLGIVAPASWLTLTFVARGFGDFIRQFTGLLRVHATTDPAGFLGGVISILSVALIVNCAYRWKREFAGFKKGIRTFAVSFGVVAAYYGVMVAWFWRAVEVAAHP